MINLGNKSFNGIGQIASVALAVSLVLKDWRDGLEFVVGHNFRGLLADTAGTLSAVFVASDGGIDLLPLSSDMLFVQSIGEVRESEREARLARDADARREELTAIMRNLEAEAVEIEDRIANIRSRIADAALESAEDIDYPFSFLIEV